MGNNQRLTSREAMDFDRLTDIIYVLLEASWGKDWGVFTMEKPTTNNSKDVKFPQIIYELNYMEIAGHGQSNTKEIKPRIRETYVEETNGERVAIQKFGQVFEGKVIFYIYTDNNKNGNIYSRKFRSFIEESKGYLMSKGLLHMHFLSERYIKENSNEDFSVREISYYLRLEEVTEIRDDVIKTINIEADSLLDIYNKESKLPSQLK